MSDDVFWIAIRAALLAMVKAIETRYMSGCWKHEKVNG